MTNENRRSTAARALRRRERKLTEEQALEVVAGTDQAVLCTCDLDGNPYGVPVTPVLDGSSRLYFHATAETGGRKEDNMAMNPRVVLTFIGKAVMVPRLYTVDYASAVVTGRASVVTDESERIRAMVRLLERHAPANSPARNAVQFRVRMPKVKVWRVDIERVTGKARAAANWTPGETLRKETEMPVQPWLLGLDD